MPIAQVHFAVNVPPRGMSVPVNALLFRAEGPRAAVVGADGKVHLKPVVIGRDYGTDGGDPGSGLDPRDRFVVLNPSDSLEEGQQVHVTKAGTATHEVARYLCDRLAVGSAAAHAGGAEIQKARRDDSAELADSRAMA